MKLFDYIVFFLISAIIFAGIHVIIDLIAADSIDWADDLVKGLMYGIGMLIWQYFSDRKKKAKK